MTIKFPLKLKGMYWRPPVRKGLCVCCGAKPKKGVFVVLNGGALLGNKKSSEMSDKLVGFWSILLHDHSSNSNMRGIDIVNYSPNGQFDFYFCNPKCLRIFLNKVADEFEKQLYK